MKRLVVLMLIVLISISSVACGKKDTVVETVQTMDMDEIDSHDVNTLKQKNDDKEVVVDCEYKIDSLSNKTIREITLSNYQFAGYEIVGERVLVLLNPKVDIPGLAEFGESLNGKTIKQLKEEYNATFQFLPLAEDKKMAATLGDISIFFNIDSEDKIVNMCNGDPTFAWADIDFVQNDQISNVEIGDIVLRALLTEDAKDKFPDLNTMTTGELLVMDEELNVEYVGYDTANK